MTYLDHKCQFHHHEIRFIDALEDAAIEDLSPRLDDLEHRIAELSETGKLTDGARPDMAGATCSAPDELGAAS